MSKPHHIIALISALLFSSVAASEISLTNTKGKTIKAELVAIHESTVEIIFKSKTITLQMDTLTEATQANLKDIKQKSDAEAEKVKKERAQALAKALADNPLKPGRQHMVEMPELQNTLMNRPASFNVYVGANVDMSKPTPILVWFSQATGSNRDSRGHRSALLGNKLDDFIVATMPYPISYGDSRSLARAAYTGKTKDLEAYHAPMLKKLKELIPNYDPRLCVAGGFSNGGHTIANYLAHDFKPFTTFFNAFIVVDGGGSDKTKFTKIKDGSLIFLIGMEHYQAKSNLFYVPIAAKKAGMDVERIEMVGTGHKFPDKYRAVVQKWLLETVIPKHLKKPLPAKN